MEYDHAQDTTLLNIHLYGTVLRENLAVVMLGYSGWIMFWW